MYEIPQSDRTLAAMTHLSGLAGYVIPLGGAIVPIIIWVIKSDSPLISTLAKQALWLNVLGFLVTGSLVLMSLTIILIPVAIILGILLFIALIAFPIVGAIKAWEGSYYSYPVVGLTL